MKTIIIHRKSSQQFLDRYRVLFQPFLESDQITFCFWDENGKDFKSALPELSDKLRGCGEWRAIVALPVEEKTTAKRIEEQEPFPCREENPFDFLQNSGPEPSEEESPIPIIRLSQMLGGIPVVTPRMGVRTVIANDGPNGELRKVREVAALEDEEVLAARREKRQQLSDKYSTNCVLPASLFLFKGYVPPEIVLPDTTDREAAERTESDSSLFWYRNRYPAKARFLTKKFSRPGNARFSADLFGYWMTVLTLALNEFPTGTFEAYKLYEAEAIISLQELHSCFSRYYDRLDHILFAAKRKIIDLKKDAQFTRENDELPKYQANITVAYRHLDDSDLMIREDHLGLASDCPVKEAPWWDRVTRLSRKALDKLISSIHPVLDRACLYCRSISNVTDEELVEMDEYQFAEMEEELGLLEEQILTFSEDGALPINTIHKMVEARRKEGATRIRKHISRRSAIGIGCVGMGLYLLSFLPELIRRLRDSGEYQPVFFALGGTLVLALASLAALYRFRRSVRAKIGNYNGTMNVVLSMIRQSAARFSTYLSQCASYMRGISMLHKLEERVMVSSSVIRKMTDHADSLKKYMQMIKSWLADFNMVPEKDEFYGKSIDFDFDIPPARNAGYQLQPEEDRDVPAEGGSTCKAPYPYIAGFRTRRQPVFEPKDKEAALADPQRIVPAKQA